MEKNLYAVVYYDLASYGTKRKYRSAKMAYLIEAKSWESAISKWQKLFNQSDFELVEVLDVRE